MSRLSALNALPLSAFLAKLWPSHPHTSTPFNLLKPPLLTENPHTTGIDINTNTHADKEPSPSSLRLHLHTPTSLSPLQFTRCFDLVRSTSGADYKASARGWRPGEKRREMRLREMRYLLLVGPCYEGEDGEGDREGTGGEGGGAGEGEGGGRGEEGRTVYGFCSFMLTLEDGIEVLYCYEIHLDERVRGKGIGKWMMGVVEEVGRRAEVEKAMLTVFKRNEVAVRFYEGLSYGVDEYSPAPKKLRNGVVKEVDYLIMSKSLRGGGQEHGEERRRKRKAG